MLRAKKTQCNLHYGHHIYTKSTITIGVDIKMFSQKIFHPNDKTCLSKDKS